MSWFDNFANIGSKALGTINTIGNKTWDLANTLGSKGLDVANNLAKTPQGEAFLASNPEVAGALAFGNTALGVSKKLKSFSDGFGGAMVEKPAKAQPTILKKSKTEPENPTRLNTQQPINTIRGGLSQIKPTHHTSGGRHPQPVDIHMTGIGRTPPMRHKKPTHTNDGSKTRLPPRSKYY